MSANADELNKLKKSKAMVGAGAAAFKKGFGKLNGKVKGLMQSRESKFNEEVIKFETLIFNELSLFV